MSIQSLNTLLAAAKNPTTNMVEWTGRLEPVLIEIRDLLLGRSLLRVANVAALQAVSGAEIDKVVVDNIGIFSFVSPGSTPNNINVYAATGGGTWELQPISSLERLTDVSITSPVNNDVLAYDASLGAWTNKTLTVSSIGWGNVTGRPTTIAGYGITVLPWASVTGRPTSLAGYGVVDKIVLLDTANNVKHSAALPLLTTGGRNIALGNLVAPSLTIGSDNVIMATNGLSGWTGGSNNVLLTNRTSLKTTGSYVVNNSIVIGDPGPLDSLLNGGAIADVIAIGVNGVKYFTVHNNGDVHINEVQNGSTYIHEDTFFTNSISVAGNITADALTLSAGLSVAAGASFAGFLISMPGLQSAANNTAALSAGMQVGTLYRAGDSVNVVH